jgi:hypothetical protein
MTEKEFDEKLEKDLESSRQQMVFFFIRQEINKAGSLEKWKEISKEKRRKIIDDDIEWWKGCVREYYESGAH